MALDQTANFVRATITSAIQAGDSIIDLSDSGQLIDPANGEFNLVLWDPSSYPRPDQDPAVEIVRATALDSGADELTVDRGQEGTSAAAHPVAAVLQLTPTAKMFADIDQKTSALSADGQSFDGDSVSIEEARIGDAYQNPKPEDGTVGIQNAIDALPADGGVVHLQVGQYDFNAGNNPYDNPPILITKPNVSVIGEGWGSRIYLPDDSTSAQSDGKGSKFIHGKEGVNTSGTILANFEIDGNQQNNGGTGDGDAIADLTDGHNIQLTGFDNVVRNVRSINATGDGTELISRADPSEEQFNLVYGNVYVNNYEQDMHNHGAWNTIWANNVARGEKTNGSIYCQAQDTDCRNVIFIGNRVHNSGRSGARLDNEAANYKTENILFVGNHITDCERHGISVLNPDGDGDMDGVAVKDNTVVGNALSGILVRGGFNVEVNGNTLRQNGDQGIILEQINAGEDTVNVPVKDNYVYNNNQNNSNSAGIRVTANGQLLKNVAVEDNEVISDTTPQHQQGILVAEPSVATYEDLTVKDNFVKGVATSNYVNDLTGAVLQRNNTNADDFVSSPPSSITRPTSTWYLDDGTNTGSGTPGMRIYHGGSWSDAWTL